MLFKMMHIQMMYKNWKQQELNNLSGLMQWMHVVCVSLFQHFMLSFSLCCSFPFHRFAWFVMGHQKQKEKETNTQRLSVEESTVSQSVFEVSQERKVDEDFVDGKRTKARQKRKKKQEKKKKDKIKGKDLIFFSFFSRQRNKGSYFKCTHFLAVVFHLKYSSERDRGKRKGKRYGSWFWIKKSLFTDAGHGLKTRQEMDTQKQRNKG